MNTDESIFNKKFSPIKQAGLILGLTIALQLLISFIPGSEKLDIWILACSMLLLYVIINSIFSFSSTDRMNYYGFSILGFAIIAIGGGLSAYLVTGLSIYEAGSFSWIYMVLSIIFLVFLTIVNMMRKIVEIAKEQDKNLRNEK